MLLQPKLFERLFFCAWYLLMMSQSKCRPHAILVPEWAIMKSVMKSDLRRKVKPHLIRFFSTFAVWYLPLSDDNRSHSTAPQEKRPEMRARYLANTMFDDLCTDAFLLFVRINVCIRTDVSTVAGNIRTNSDHICH